MKKYFLLVVLLLLNIPVLLADDPTDPGLPCGGSGPDPGTDCPIDTWVVAFAALVMILATFYLYRQQRNVSKLSKS